MPRAQKKARGVWYRTWTTGETELAAFDSRGERVAKRVVPPGGDVATELELMYAYLNYEVDVQGGADANA
jgi:hypothetical protein